MKSSRKFIAIAFGLGILMWVIDTLLDYLVFYRGQGFWKLLLFDPPEHEIYIRAIILASCILFGYLLSRDHQRLSDAIKAEQAARAYSNTIIGSVPQGIVVYDTEFNYVVWNAGMEKIVGVMAEEVLGKNALELFPHLKRTGTDKLIEKAMRGEKSQTYQNSFTDDKVYELP